MTPITRSLERVLPSTLVPWALALVYAVLLAGVLLGLGSERADLLYLDIHTGG